MIRLIYFLRNIVIEISMYKSNIKILAATQFSISKMLPLLLSVSTDEGDDDGFPWGPTEEVSLNTSLLVKCSFTASEMFLSK